MNRLSVVLAAVAGILGGALGYSQLNRPAPETDTAAVRAIVESMLSEREALQAELVNGWPNVAPRKFDFDGKTFRKPGGQAPQMVWDEKTNQMTLQIFIGRNPAFTVVLRPVPGFHDNPFAAG